MKTFLIFTMLMVSTVAQAEISKQLHRSAIDQSTPSCISTGETITVFEKSKPVWGSGYITSSITASIGQIYSTGYIGDIRKPEIEKGRKSDPKEYHKFILTYRKWIEQFIYDGSIDCNHGQNTLLACGRSTGAGHWSYEDKFFNSDKELLEDIENYDEKQVVSAYDLTTLTAINLKRNTIVHIIPEHKITTVSSLDNNKVEEIVKEETWTTHEWVQSDSVNKKDCK
jgi:hypothetical protein